MTAPATESVSTTSIAAPQGSHFEFEEIKTGRGSETLGEVPILVWDDLDQVVEHFGIQGVLDVLDGTSVRVSYQNIARRYKIANKTVDEIAAAQVAFRPGKRTGGSTPKSRATKAVSAASEKVGGDALAQLLEKIARGEVDMASLGIQVQPTTSAPAAE